MNTVKGFFKKFSQASNCAVTLIDVTEGEIKKETPLFSTEIRNEDYKGFESYKINMMTFRDNALLLYIEAR